MNYLECLPIEISSYLQNVAGVRELRIRNGQAVRVNVCGKWFWVGKNSLLPSKQFALQFSDICDEFVKKACNSSVYAYEKMLSQGYFTLSDGTRIGVCGILGANNIFQKYTSLCIRTAQYFSCADESFSGSVIVVGTPRSGKTTYLRDLACRLSNCQNVVVVDERGEISNCNGFEKMSCCDVLQYASKKYAFEVAVRTMSPDWVVCDELSQSDFPLLENVSASGVKLAASIHAQNMKELKTRLGDYLCNFAYAVFLQKDSFKKTVVELENC